MGLLDWISPFNKVADIVSEVVEDKDKRNQIMHELETLKQQVYMKELDTKTVPWIDALHKMQRGILSLVSMGIGVYMVHSGITDPIALAASFAPAGGYNIVKGKGKP